VKILFIGDTVARPGRTMVHDSLKQLQEDLEVDLTILNCENAAAGFGVTPTIADEFFNWGVDVLTSGNHIWDKKEIFPYLKPIRGSFVRQTILRQSRPRLRYRSNACGRAVCGSQSPGPCVHAPTDDPFRVADAELAKLSGDVKVIFVDMHGEATSEKVAMGWYLDGRVSAVIGTTRTFRRQTK
jgi:calcineurin-like phosphoesterase